MCTTLFQYKHTGSVQQVSLPATSYAKMECWGAQGGDATSNTIVFKGGRGGYTCGCISLDTSLSLYIYVGEAGSYIPSPSSPNIADTAEKGVTYNGGGAAQNHSCVTATGGGATDVRLTNGNWNDFNSLKSRIIVAGAGGGGNTYNGAGDGSGGYAGGLNGGDGAKSYFTGMYNAESAAAKAPSKGGTQICGGELVEVGDVTKGSFGQGGSIASGGYRQGGGSGYYGGAAGSAIGGMVFSGAGGSSFISGHTGCNAISSSSISTNIVHTGQPNHYSGYVFTNTVMKAGNESMPSPTGGTETGHSGNGYCKITWHPAL